MKKKTGIYIHFPFCKIKCGYCDFYSITDREDSIPIFIDSLIKEIKLYFNSHDVSEFNFDSMFLGGGTPSLIPSSAIEEIFKTLSDYVDISTLKEITTVLTRLGKNSRCFILSDPMQTDLNH